MRWVVEYYEQADKISPEIPEKEERS